MIAVQVDCSGAFFLTLSQSLYLGDSDFVISDRLRYSPTVEKNHGICYILVCVDF